MIPWLVFAVIVVPLVVVGFAVTRRRSATRMPATDEAELEREFAAAEAYEAEWHEKESERFHDARLP